ncbi:MAG: hypothetical protein EHM33_00510 [Chloroflexi bacterium]|nr:MAG: hypothetical protein EHM33_00510 [Chloroflexota bacterium]
MPAKSFIVNPQAVSVEVPDFMKTAKAGQGTEGLSHNALTPPRLKLIQATSPELAENDKLRPGVFSNNVTEQDYGQTVDIIPCYLSEAYFLFAPRLPGVPGGLLARANDGIHWQPANTSFDVVIDKKGAKTTWTTADTVAKSGLDVWGTFDPNDKKSPPAATHVLNCVCLVVNDLGAGPMVVSFLRSGLKVGKKFAGNLKMARVPSFGRVFQLSSFKVEGQSGPYYEPRVKAAGFVGDVNTYNEAEAIYQMARAQGVDVDIASEAHEPANTTVEDVAGKY